MTTFDGNYTATLPRKRMGSGVLFRDASDRVLLVEPVYKDYWELLPGGAVDGDESPHDAARREVEEELGFTSIRGRRSPIGYERSTVRALEAHTA
ncbi:NUDIX domain-containing protein [Dactylosporangium sp. McL0621]|uniref:NUDIX domain-containing protein n=1 Tax=Dactylosporangium sp. McL0621 TaxID=3415678 RepID=UPI003CF9178D